jgi:DNA-binding transcriptional ArsR family regulator
MSGAVAAVYHLVCPRLVEGSMRAGQTLRRRTSTVPPLRKVVLGLALAVFIVLVLAPSALAQCDCGDMEGPMPGMKAKAWLQGVATSPLMWGLAGIGVAGLAFVAWRLGWVSRGAAAFLLFSRFQGDDLEDHPTRSRIVDRLRESPGVGTRALADLAEVNAATLLYHLEILARFGRVKSQRLGRQRVWYLTQAPRPDLRRAAMLSVPARKQLYDLIQASPGSTQAELARRMGLSAATIHHHLYELADAGLVELRRDGSRQRCFATGTPVSVETTDASRSRGAASLG